MLNFWMLNLRCAEYSFYKLWSKLSMERDIPAIFKSVSKVQNIFCALKSHHELNLTHRKSHISLFRIFFLKNNLFVEIHLYLNIPSITKTQTTQKSSYMASPQALQQTKTISWHEVLDDIIMPLFWVLSIKIRRVLLVLISQISTEQLTINSF